MGVSASFGISNWDHPIVYKHISLVLLYPLIWGLYYSILGLGQTLDVYHIIVKLMPDYLIPLICVSPYLLL